MWIGLTELFNRLLWENRMSLCSKSTTSTSLCGDMFTLMSARVECSTRSVLPLITTLPSTSPSELQETLSKQVTYPSTIPFFFFSLYFNVLGWVSDGGHVLQPNWLVFRTMNYGYARIFANATHFNLNFHGDQRNELHDSTWLTKE